jgi:hypothetical protein
MQSPSIVIEGLFLWERIGHLANYLIHTRGLVTNHLVNLFVFVVIKRNWSPR